MGDSIFRKYKNIDVYNLCDWYLYSTQIQRLLPSIIIHTQSDVYIKAYGNIECSRDTFKRVIIKLKEKKSKLFHTYFKKLLGISQIGQSALLVQTHHQKLADFIQQFIENIKCVQAF